MDEAAGRGSQHSRKSTTETTTAAILCGTLKELCINTCPQSSMNESVVVKKSEQSSSGGDVRDYSQRNHRCNSLLNPGGDVLHTAAAFGFSFGRSIMTRFNTLCIVIHLSCI